MWGLLAKFQVSNWNDYKTFLIREINYEATFGYIWGIFWYRKMDFWNQKIILDNAKYGFFVKSEINFRYQKSIFGIRNSNFWYRKMILYVWYHA